MNLIDVYQMAEEPQDGTFRTGIALRETPPHIEGAPETDQFQVLDIQQPHQVCLNKTKIK